MFELFETLIFTDNVVRGVVFDVDVTFGFRVDELENFIDSLDAAPLVTV